MITSIKSVSGKFNKGAAFGILLTVMCIAFIIGSIITKAQTCAANTNENKYFTNITVNDGDSLWAVAEQYMDNTHYSSVYEYMDEIKNMNNLSSDDIYAGQNLVVTYYSSTVQ